MKKNTHICLFTCFWICNKENIICSDLHFYYIGGGGGGGAHLKRIAPGGGGRKNFWGFSWEKSRFPPKKSFFFQPPPPWIRLCYLAYHKDHRGRMVVEFTTICVYLIKAASVMA
jgi:hypothetical protein